MENLRLQSLMLAFVSFLCLPAGAAESVSPDPLAATANLFQIKVVFDKVDFIHLGELGHFTTVNQNISFSVFVTELVNEDTQENLINGPDAFFAVPDFTLNSDSPVKPFLYCLDTLREMALNPNPGTRMVLFLDVRKVSGTNFVVRKFRACDIQTVV